MRVVFMGTPDFSVGTLRELAKAGHEIAGVVSQPDKPKGRGKNLQPTPVKEAAMELGLPVYQPQKVRDPEFIQVMKELNPDVIVVVAFGQIIPKEILHMPKYGCINVHASLLPAYRGAAPIQWAVINGDKESGVTIMRMDEGVDTGDMINKVIVPLNEKETALLRREEERRGITLVEWPRNPTYNMCFACGTENPIGLHLHFFPLPQGCLSLFTPSREHQSYNDRMHGGLIMTLMDEVMGNYLFLKDGIPAYTGKMESRFRQPILIGETVLITCEEVRRKGHLIVMSAKITKEDGTIAAEATSHMMLGMKE